MLATSCPECQTRFRVSSEQLRLRHGMVRCGRCGHVFNGGEHLSYLPDLPTTEENAEMAAPAGQPAAQREDSAASAPAAFDAPAHESAHASAEASDYDPGQESPHPDGPLTLIDFSGAEDDEAPAAAEAQEEEAAPEAAPEETSASAQPHLPPLELPKASFLRQHPRQRWVALLYACLYVCGLLVLLAQGVYVFRNTLAAYWPASKPWLVQMCAPLACRIEPLQQPDAISIEASDLQAARQQKDVYTLNVLLRNRSHFPQQLPALEIWLTDLQNRPLVRRVFLPVSYIEPQHTALREGLAPDSELTIKLHWQAPDLAASGYRVYAFYP